MKKVFFFFTLCFLTVTSMSLQAAYTIDVAKSYVLQQSLATSSKVIGANSTTPSVISADISDVSQRLSFELVSTGIYRIKNGSGNYLSCNSLGVICYASALDETTDAQWTIADIGTTPYVKISSVSLATSYLTSATVITGPAAFTGSPLTLTTTAPTAIGLAAFKLVEAITGTYPVFANLLADASFENVAASNAPMGEWVNDKSQTMGGSGKSRVFATYPSTGSNSLQLRFNLTTGSNYGYYNVSHKLNGLIPGSTYQFGFKYKVDGTTSTTVPVANAKANVYATTTTNAAIANAIGGATNFVTTTAPTVIIASQTPSTSPNLTFVAPASSCYIVFSKYIQDETTIFYIYMDEMTLTKIETPTVSASVASLALDGMDNEKTFTVSGVNLSNDISFSGPAGISFSPTTLPANSTNATVTVTYDKTTSVAGAITISSGSASTTVDVTGSPSYQPEASVKYYLLQTTLLSSKVVGATLAIQPALNNVDMYLSQQFEFIPVAGETNTYYLKNDSAMYLNSVGTTSDVIYESATNSANSKWMISGTTINSLKFKNVATGAFLTSANVSAETALTASGLTADANAVFKLVPKNIMVQNNMIDGGFEIAQVNSAPLGTWINDQSKVLGCAGKSRIFANGTYPYACTGSNGFQLRFGKVSLDSYYSISKLLTGLEAGQKYKVSFNYRIDGSATNSVPAVGSNAYVFAASAANDAVANAIGGSTNYFETVIPVDPIATQAINAGNVTFTATSSKNYLVFAKSVAADNPEYYIYLDDMTIENVTNNTGLSNSDKSNFNVIVEDNGLRVIGANSFEVYSMQGLKMCEVLNNSTNTTIALKASMYIVKSNKSVQKVIIK